MSLTLKSKVPVRFEWTDGIAETAIVLSPGDDEETLKRKLGRILTLAGEEDLDWAKHPSPAWTRPRQEPGGTASLDSAVGNGWATMTQVPEVPERLQGEVELIEEGEGE